MNLINFTSFGQSLYLSGVLFVKSLVGSLVKKLEGEVQSLLTTKKFPSRPPNISKDEIVANRQKTTDEERRRATFSNQYVYLNVIGIFLLFLRCSVTGLVCLMKKLRGR